jgi:AraC-like DNA-binding protein
VEINLFATEKRENSVQVLTTIKENKTIHSFDSLLNWLLANSLIPPVQLLDANDFGSALSDTAGNCIKEFVIKDPRVCWNEIVVPDGTLILVSPTEGVSLVRSQGRTFLLESGVSALIAGPASIDILLSRHSTEFIVTAVNDPGITALAGERTLGIRRSEMRLLLNSDVLSPALYFEQDYATNFENRSFEKRNAMLAILLATSARKPSLSELFALKYSGSPGSMYEVLKEIWKSPELDWNLSRLAQITNYSPFHVSRLFRSEFSIGFKDYVTECRARRAIEAICWTKNSLEEIGDRVGYPQRQMLRGAIKSATGFLPSDVLRFARNDGDLEEEIFSDAL